MLLMSNSSFGYYWSSVNSEQNGKITATTFQIEIDEANKKVNTMQDVAKNRSYGMPIRPVRKEKRKD